MYTKDIIHPEMCFGCNFEIRHIFYGNNRRKERARLVPLAATYVDHFAVVSLAQIVQYGSFVQIGQIGHIFDFFEFRRIRL